MISKIHGDGICICQWAGEAIPEGQKFKIPAPELNGRFKGCYGSPGAAIAKMSQLAKQLAFEKDKYEEYLDMFQTTLRRTDYRASEPYTIQVAPESPELILKTFNRGGQMDIEEFHAKYDHDEQIKMFTQVLPETEPKKEKTTWKLTPFGFPKKHDLGESGIPRKAEVPKNFSNWRTWLNVHGDSLAVSLHPKKSDLLCVWDYRNYGEKYNKPASKAMGGVEIFGQATVYHKRNTISKKRKANEISEEEKPKIVKKAKTEKKTIKKGTKKGSKKSV